MKVILYMAMTVNGMIAKEDDATPWSEEEWRSYEQIVKETKNLVIGRRTYELLKKEDLENLDNPTVVVMSSKVFNSENKNIYFVNSPENAIKVLKEKGFEKILVGGGGIVNASFMEQGLVDEIYLDIEPLVFGKGIPLFSGKEFSYTLELLETNKLNKNLVQLHYEVKR